MKLRKKYWYNIMCIVKGGRLQWFGWERAWLSERCRAHQDRMG